MTHNIPPLNGGSDIVIFSFSDIKLEPTQAKGVQEAFTTQ